MIQRVYKAVFYNLDGKLQSLYCGRHALFYSVDQWTFPKYGRLFAFKDHESACNFMSHSPTFIQLYVAEAQDPHPHEGRVARWLEDVEAFWQGEPVKTARAPAGTVSCASLKLLHRVSKEPA